jgi:cobalt/nickel transport system permease protein
VRIRLDDPFVNRPSIVHRLPAGAKLFAAFGIVITAVALPRTAWLGYSVIGIALLIVIALSRLPLIRILKRLALLEPFVLAVALLSLWQRDGVLVFAGLVTKGTISLFAMILLVATTRFSDVLRVFRRLRLPSIMVTTISLMYRYLFLILEEMTRMTRARASRTFASEHWLTWHSLANVIGHLFVRTSERAERIYAAMCARGWKT